MPFLLKSFLGLFADVIPVWVVRAPLPFEDVMFIVVVVVLGLLVVIVEITCLLDVCRLRVGPPEMPVVDTGAFGRLGFLSDLAD